MLQNTTVPPADNRTLQEETQLNIQNPDEPSDHNPESLHCCSCVTVSTNVAPTTSYTEEETKHLRPDDIQRENTGTVLGELSNI